MLVGGSGSAALAKKISAALGQPLAQLEHKKFPDGEVYVRLKSKADDKAIIVQGTHSPQYENLMELLLLADLLKSEGAEVCAVIPYLLHARQDKKFLEGEPVSSETVCKLLKAVGISRIITVDLHFHRKEGKFDLFGIPAYNIAAAPLLVDHFAKKHNPLTIITPDAGSADQAAAVGGKSLKKRRISSYEVEMEGLPDIRGKNVLILDDMITTGGTMRKAVQNVRKRGASKVLVAATHAAFCQGAYEKIKKLADEIVTTDAIPHPTSKVSVSEKIAYALKKW